MTTSFGEVMRRLRKGRAMTLDQVARKIGTQKGYLSGIENGLVNPPSVRFVRKLAKLFGQDDRKMVLLAWIEKAPEIIKPELRKLRTRVGTPR